MFQQRTSRAQTRAIAAAIEATSNYAAIWALDEHFTFFSTDFFPDIEPEEARRRIVERLGVFSLPSDGF